MFVCLLTFYSCITPKDLVGNVEAILYGSSRCVGKKEVVPGGGTGAGGLGEEEALRF